MEQDPEPLKGQVYYFDNLNLSLSASRRRRLETSLVDLGAQVERFLSKEITYIITEKTLNDSVDLASGLSSIPDRSPDSCVSIASETDGKAKGTKASVAPLSRGRALLMKSNARERNAVPDRNTRNPKDDAINFARRWDIKIMALNDLQDLVADHLKASGRQTRRRKNSKLKVKKLQGSYLKFQDTSATYKPCWKILQKVPTVNIDPEANLEYSPFDNVKRKLEDNVTHEKENKNPNVLVPYKGSARPVVSESRDKELKDRVITVPQKVPAKTKPKKKSPPGYCECCDAFYDNLSQHVLSDTHVNFIKEKENFESLDQLISHLPSLEQFTTQFSNEGSNQVSVVSKDVERCLRRVEERKEVACQSFSGFKDVSYLRQVAIEQNEHTRRQKHVFDEDCSRSCTTNSPHRTPLTAEGVSMSNIVSTGNASADFRALASDAFSSFVHTDSSVSQTLTTASSVFSTESHQSAPVQMSPHGQDEQISQDSAMPPKLVVQCSPISLNKSLREPPDIDYIGDEGPVRHNVSINTPPRLEAMTPRERTDQTATSCALVNNDAPQLLDTTFNFCIPKALDNNTLNPEDNNQNVSASLNSNPTVFGIYPKSGQEQKTNLPNSFPGKPSFAHDGFHSNISSPNATRIMSPRSTCNSPITAKLDAIISAVTTPCYTFQPITTDAAPGAGRPGTCPPSEQSSRSSAIPFTGVVPNNLPSFPVQPQPMFVPPAVLFAHQESSVSVDGKTCFNANDSSFVPESPAGVSADTFSWNPGWDIPGNKGSSSLDIMKHIAPGKNVAPCFSDTEMSGIGNELHNAFDKALDILQSDSATGDECVSKVGFVPSHKSSSRTSIPHSASTRGSEMSEHSDAKSGVTSSESVKTEMSELLNSDCTSRDSAFSESSIADHTLKPQLSDTNVAMEITAIDNRPFAGLVSNNDSDVTMTELHPFTNQDQTSALQTPRRNSSPISQYNNNELFGMNNNCMSVTPCKLRINRSVSLDCSPSTGTKKAAPKRQRRSSIAKTPKSKAPVSADSGGSTPRRTPLRTCRTSAPTEAQLNAYLVEDFFGGHQKKRGKKRSAAPELEAVQEVPQVDCAPHDLPNIKKRQKRKHDMCTSPPSDGTDNVWHVRPCGGLKLKLSKVPKTPTSRLGVAKSPSSWNIQKSSDMKLTFKVKGLNFHADSSDELETGGKPAQKQNNKRRKLFH